MDFLGEQLMMFLHAIVQLFTHPLYYAGILLIALQYRRQIYLERKLFHTKLHSLLEETGRTMLWGWCYGLMASVVMALLGAAISPQALFWIWGAALLAALVRIRFLCLAYAAGMIALLQYISSFYNAVFYPDWVTNWLTPLIQSLQAVQMSSLLALVAFLHIIEGVLILTQGKRMMTPLFLEGKRGKIVGGYQLQGFWPVPLFLMVPLQSGGSQSWSPFFGGELWQHGWTIAAFPTIIGFMELTKTMLPKAKLKLTSKRMFIYSFIVLAMAAAVEFWHPLAVLAGVLTMLLHEGMIYLSTRAEEKGKAILIHDSRGLYILGVVPKSPAAQLGIQPGEIIVRANGIDVRTKEELHQALRMNPAYCKLDVLNSSGELKFYKRALFSGEHHQLGILLAPDDNALYYLDDRGPKSLISFLMLKLSGLLSNSTNHRSAAK